MKFVEDVLVSSLDLLKEGAVLPISGGSMLRENHGGPVKRNPGSDGDLSAPEIVRRDLTSSVGDGAVESSDVDAVANENGKVVESSDSDASKENRFFTASDTDIGNKTRVSSRWAENRFD